MTNALKTFDDAIRRSVEEKRRQARDEPSKLILNQVVTQAIDVWLLRRIAGKLGLDLTRLQAYALVGIFGRDPGYPLNLIWQERQVKPEVSVAAKKLADDLLKAMVTPRRTGPGSPPRPRRPIPREFEEGLRADTTRSPGGRKLPGEFDDE